MTMPLSIAFSRATASAICNSSSLFALTAMGFSLSLRPAAAGRSGLVSSCLGLLVLGRSVTAAPLGGLPRLLVGRQCRANEVVGQHQAGLGNRIVRDGDRRRLALRRRLAGND